MYEFDHITQFRAGQFRRSQKMDFIAGYARKAMRRARDAKSDTVLVDAVIRAEQHVAHLRAYDAGGFFRNNNFARLVSLEKSLRVLKAKPVVIAALEL